jgi:hypothetical protein
MPRGLKNARWENYFRKMTNGAGHHEALGARENGRQRRLSLVLMLTIGLLVSLIHCGTCDLAFAGSNTTTVAASLDGSGVPDIPEQQLPVHSGHCLSHITAQTIAAVQFPINVSHQIPPLGRAQTLASIAGLPLFKPPRA